MRQTRCRCVLAVGDREWRMENGECGAHARVKNFLSIAVRVPVPDRSKLPFSPRAPAVLPVLNHTSTSFRFFRVVPAPLSSSFSIFNSQFSILNSFLIPHFPKTRYNINSTLGPVSGILLTDGATAAGRGGVSSYRRPCKVGRRQQEEEEDYANTPPTRATLQSAVSPFALFPQTPGRGAPPVGRGPDHCPGHPDGPPVPGDHLHSYRPL